jgi:cytochrome c-type biogenesis protein CcmE
VTTTEAKPARTVPAEPAKKQRRPALRLGVVGVVVALAIGFLLVKGLGSSLDYFKTVNEAVHQRSQLGMTTFRLEGTVVPGTVERTKLGASFDISSGKDSVHVVNSGTPPQLFQPTVPVVVVGHFSSATSSTFLSNEIMVKHSSSYIQAHPNRVRAGNGTAN